MPGNFSSYTHDDDQGVDALRAVKSPQLSDLKEQHKQKLQHFIYSAGGQPGQVDLNAVPYHRQYRGAQNQDSEGKHRSQAKGIRSERSEDLRAAAALDMTEMYQALDSDDNNSASLQSYELSCDLSAHMHDIYAVATFAYNDRRRRELVLERGELILKRGDLIRLNTLRSDGWLDGVIGDHRGWFPANHCALARQFGNDWRASGFSIGQVMMDLSVDEVYWTVSPTTRSTAGRSRIDSHSADPSLSLPPLEQRQAKLRASKDIWHLSRESRISLMTQTTEAELSSDGEISFTGSNPVSGDTTPSNDLMPESKELVLRLASRILEGYAKFQGRPATSGTMEQQAESGGSSAASSPRSSAHSKSTSTTVHSVSKRKLGKIIENSEDDDDDQVSSQKRAKAAYKEGVKLFACPFAKYDPERYSERNTVEREYRGCSSCLLRDIARLKQHLYRVHRRPDHYCPSCFDAFKTQALLDEHVRERFCETTEPMYAEKMTKDQMNLIKRRHRGETPAQSWFSVFKILFPGARVPDSPYAGEIDGNQDTTLQHFVHYFRTFGPEQFFNLMRDRQGSVQRLEASTQAIVDEAFEIAAPELLRQMRSRSSSRTDPPSPADVRHVSALQAAGAISHTPQHNSAREPWQALDPHHVQSNGLNTNSWLTPWEAQPNASSSGLPDFFDFDTTFDPLTIEDSFMAYGSWNIP